MNGKCWISWYLAVILPGTGLVLGLQDKVGLPFGYLMAAMLFVIVLALAVAESMEFVTVKRKAFDFNDIEAFDFNDEETADAFMKAVERELNGK